ncbi:hypothetical protein ABH944_004467 [Caballeronia udeis]|jgi:hypothetical protein|uniref:Uncharacterized protein n=1 Tax=Caballeronia udeis TaxID=1232866 RepID=A0ABW8MK46_9BURK
MHIHPYKTLAGKHRDEVKSEQRTACWKGPWSACAIEMREQPAQRPAVDRPGVEGSGHGSRHGRGLKTLQHLLDLPASFTRRRHQMRCDNTLHLAVAIGRNRSQSVAIDIRIQHAARFALAETALP